MFTDNQSTYTSGYLQSIDISLSPIKVDLHGVDMPKDVMKGWDDI